MNHKLTITPILLIIATAACCIAFYGCTTHWPVYAAYDNLQTMGFLRASAEGGWNLWTRTCPRLGAPDAAADWAGYPMYSAMSIWAWGQLTRPLDVFTVLRLMVLAGHITSALGMYAAVRLVGGKRSIAFGLGLLWAFTAYHSWRGVGHIFLAFDWGVPLAVAFAYCWLNGKRLVWLGVLLAVAFGQGDPYRLMIWCMVLWFLGWVGSKKENL